MVPTNAKGVKLICRTSNEYRAAVLGSPFDYPLSSRLDENDAIFVLDDVLDALGGRVRLWRRREGEQFLPAHRLLAAGAHPRLHAAWR